MKKIFSILLTMQILFAVSLEPIRSGEAVNSSVQHKDKKFYSITVPRNKSLKVELKQLEADLDLYVKRGKEVRVRFNDCDSSKSYQRSESCLLTNRGQTSTYTILVNGFQSSSFTLIATIIESEEIPTLSNETIEDAVEYKESKQYQVSGKRGQPITITLSDLTGDADLRVKVAQKATLHSFDCKSNRVGTKTDECRITPKKDATVYVQVYGYESATYSLKAVKETNIPQLNVLAPSFKNSKIITQAKEHCLNQKKNTKRVFCSNQENIVFVLNFEAINERAIEGKLYKVNITEGEESAYMIKKYDNRGHKIREGDVYFLKESQKFDHYCLINHRYPSVYLTGNISLVNYSGKTLLRFPYYEAFKHKILSIKAMKNSKMSIVESKKTPLEAKEKKIRKVYDIRNSNKATLLSEEII